MKAIIILTGIIAIYVQAEYVPTKQDSGWIPLWNGEDFDGLYIHQGSFIIEDGMIKRNDGSNGYVRTTSMYSHYHVRVNYQFTDGPGQGNAGMLYHFTEDGVWPTCLENQMLETEAASLILLGNTRAIIEVENGNYYKEGGTPIEFDNTGQSWTRIYGSGSHDLQGEWNTLEHRVWGDSLFEHIINSHVVLRGTRPNHGATRIPMTLGYILLQSEGAPIQYKDWEIRFFPSDSNYISYIPGCRDTSYQEYSDSANLHIDSMCVTKNNSGLRNAAAPGFINISKKPGLSVNITSAGPHSLCIYNLAGELVVSKKSKGSRKYILKEVTDAGVYFLVIQTPQETTIGKLFVSLRWIN
jgi:hypothetical protein